MSGFGQRLCVDRLMGKYAFAVVCMASISTGSQAVLLPEGSTAGACSDHLVVSCAATLGVQADAFG